MWGLGHSRMQWWEDTALVLGAVLGTVVLGMVLGTVLGSVVLGARRSGAGRSVRLGGAGRSGARCSAGHGAGRSVLICYSPTYTQLSWARRPLTKRAWGLESGEVPADVCGLRRTDAGAPGGASRVISVPFCLAAL